MKGAKALVFLAVLVTLSAPALAIRGSIGNGIIYIDEVLARGETKVVEKSITVNNQNNITVDIKVDAISDLKNITDVLDNEFSLEPGESRDARFKIELKGDMQLEGRIAVAFSPSDKTSGDAGVGLQSKVRISTKVDNSTSAEPNNNDKNPLPGKTTESGPASRNNPVVGMIIIAIILAIGILLYLLVTKKVR
ncbi:hypothetical protein JXA85_03635 [Candidatus Woesearchaeota archaeon]|nr:hypothetical protein [Candidatus Woesearchaeota archaeon]